MSFSPNDVMTILTIIGVTIVLLVWVSKRPGPSMAALTISKEYRALAEEYRRLSDMAITAQEHVDLRLTDLSVQLDALRDQLDQMQRILKEVE
jgi:hypothetical protein